MIKLEEAKEHAVDLKESAATRVTLQDEMEKLYLLTWDEESKVEQRLQNVKITKSPDPRNKAQGAIRLLTASEPKFSVPDDENENIRNQDDIEKAAATLWKAAGRVAGKPIHYDAVTSMIVYGMQVIGITATKDLAEHHKGSYEEERYNRIEQRTPFLFDVYDPRVCFPEVDGLGLRTIYLRESLTRKEIYRRYGKAGQIDSDWVRDANPDVLNTYWGYGGRIVWVDSKDGPIFQEENNLGFIPFSVSMGEGSRIFEEPEYWSVPFLYTVWKTGLWARLNLALTVMYTNIYNIGANPQYVYTRSDPNKHIEMDYSQPGGVFEIEQGETLTPLQKQVIDQSISQGLEIATQLTGESTIYSQTLGEPLGENAPYSMVALLHQAGRQPLIVPQRMASWGIADTVKTSLMWAKKDKIEHRALSPLVPADLPEVFELEAELEVNLPQDDAQNANTAAALTQGDNPLTSVKYARENVLNIGQPQEMQREIWAEQVANALAASFMQDQVSRILAMTQGPPPGAMQGPPPGGMEGQPVGPPPGQIPEVPAADVARAGPGAPLPPMQPMAPMPPAANPMPGPPPGEEM